MRRRDLAIVAAVVAIAGVAAADALRFGDADPAPQATTAPPPREERPTAAEPELDTTGYRTGLLHGSLVFTDAADCRLREVGLAEAAERRLPERRGDCTLWAPREGPYVAYGVGGARPGRFPFALFDLDNPERDLGAFAALSRFVAWSLDGRRAGWCDEDGRGLDHDVGSGRARRLPGCPVAYTPDGQAAFLADERLVVRGRTVLRAPGTITLARWGTDGSLAVVVDGRRLERWQGGRRTHAISIPTRMARSSPIVSPDNCGALVFDARDDVLKLIDVGCLRPSEKVEGLAVPAAAAAWSPDGEWVAWIATDGPRRIGFDKVVGRHEATELRVGAVELAWRG